MRGKLLERSFPHSPFKNFQKRLLAKFVAWFVCSFQQRSIRKSESPCQSLSAKVFGKGCRGNLFPENMRGKLLGRSFPHSPFKNFEKRVIGKTRCFSSSFSVKNNSQKRKILPKPFCKGFWEGVQGEPFS